jgi:integrase
MLDEISASAYAELPRSSRAAPILRASLATTAVGSIKVSHTPIALRIAVTCADRPLRRHDLAAEVWRIKEPLKLPPVLSPEEVKRVLTMATSLKARAMLTLACGCGLRAGEVVRLRAGDIDREQVIIRIGQSKGRKDRHVMLPAEVLDLLRQWWKARPTEHDAGVAPHAIGRETGLPFADTRRDRLGHAVAVGCGGCLCVPGRVDDGAPTHRRPMNGKMSRPRAHSTLPVG